MEQSNSEQIIWVASFDIGKKNFAFCVEEFDMADLYRLSKSLPNKSNRYNADGTCTVLFSNLLSKVYGMGRVLLLCNHDLTKYDQVSQNTEIVHNMTDLLDKYSSYWNQCDTFMIEKQMIFGNKKSNPFAFRLGLHCLSYFALNN